MSSYSVNITRKILKDHKKIKDCDLRVFIHINDNLNIHGFTDVSNGNTIENGKKIEGLEDLCGKGKRAIQKSLKRLEEHKFIEIVHNAKHDGDAYYKEHYPRVIWLKAEYDSYITRHKKPVKEKTVKTDFLMFINWLRTDCVGIPFYETIGGLSSKYIIHADKKLWIHESGDEPTLLHKDDSHDVYMKIWAKRKHYIALFHPDYIEEKN